MAWQDKQTLEEDWIIEMLKKIIDSKIWTRKRYFYLHSMIFYKIFMIN